MGPTGSNVAQFMEERRRLIELVMITLDWLKELEKHLLIKKSGVIMSTLKVRWPWTMLPLSVADEYIKYLQERIDPECPLYGKQVFPSCIREDSQDLIIQFDLDDDNSHAIVFFGEKQLFGNKKMPRLEIIASVSDLQERFDQDHRNAMESLDDLDD